MGDSICKKCKAPVKWIKTEKGKNMILDAKPSRRYVLDEMLEHGKFVNTYMPHFASCKYVDEFRKEKK